MVAVLCHNNQVILSGIVPVKWGLFRLAPIITMIVADWHNLQLTSIYNILHDCCICTIKLLGLADTAILIFGAPIKFKHVIYHVAV